MTRIDEIREFWANTAPSPDCCTTVFGKMASEHIAVLLAEVKRLRESEIEWKNKAWDLSKKIVDTSEAVLAEEERLAKNQWDETTVESIVGSVITAYKDVESAPDESLSPRDAWVVGAGYVAEFTCRELWRKGIITQEEAVPVFKATGGDIEDPLRWVKP